MPFFHSCFQLESLNNTNKFRKKIPLYEISLPTKLNDFYKAYLVDFFYFSQTYIPDVAAGFIPHFGNECHVLF